MSAQGGIPGRGGVCPGVGGCLTGGCLPRGCTWSWGVYLVRYSPPPVDRMTHASENITLPQTSFASGKYDSF